MVAAEFGKVLTLTGNAQSKIPRIGRSFPREFGSPFENAHCSKVVQFPRSAPDFLGYSTKLYTQIVGVNGQHTYISI